MLHLAFLCHELRFSHRSSVTIVRSLNESGLFKQVERLPSIHRYQIGPAGKYAHNRSKVAGISSGKGVTVRSKFLANGLGITDPWETNTSFGSQDSTKADFAERTKGLAD